MVLYGHLVKKNRGPLGCLRIYSYSVFSLCQPFFMSTFLVYLLQIEGYVKNKMRHWCNV